MRIFFDDNYWEEAFHCWYSNNQPSTPDAIHRILPENADGNKPSSTTIREAMNRLGWHERADAMNAQAVVIAEKHYIEEKAQMLIKQAEDARAIADKAKEKIIEDGFDNSTSAVNAYFKATEEERTTRGVTEWLIKMNKSSADELLAEATALVRRKSETIDVEAEEVDDASSQ